MKAYITTIVIIIVLSINNYAQKWEHLIGYPNTNDGMLEVLESYDNGYLISGGSYMHEGMWIIKTDINGDILWDKVITHNTNTLAAGYISQNKSGDIAIASLLSFPNGDQWPLITKLDSCGNKLWCRYYIDDDYNSGSMQDVIIFDNGDVLALGYMQSLENYNERIFLYYIDTNGNLVWRQSYASKENHPLVLERLGGGVHQFGNQYIITGKCYYPNPGDTLPGYLRPFYIGIDSEFKEQWILPFGTNYFIKGQANDVIPLNDSVYMGVGYMWDENSNENSLYMFFNDNGDELGYTRITNEEIGPDIMANIPESIARLNDSLFIAATYFGPGDYSNPFGEFIIDTAGNIYKMESRPNTGVNSTIIKSFDGKYIIGTNYKHPNSDWDIYLYKINDSLEMDTVYPGNYTYDSLCPYQIESGVIDITDCLLITDVGEVPTPGEYFASLNTVLIKAYPNPVYGNEVTFKLQNTQHHINMELKCFDIFGKLVHSEKVYQFQGESKVNIQNWQAGMYMALIYSSNRVVGQAKFVVQ